MKVKQISEHVWSLKTWMIIPIHVWLVVDEGGVTLVDAGISTMSGGILKAVNRLEAGPLNQILLTHGHSDHVGAIGSIMKSNPVPVYAHRIEIPYMEGELPYPRRNKAVTFLAKGLAQPLREDGAGQLQSVAGLTPYLAPGHSPGHVVYYHEQDKVLLAGDLFTSRNGKLRHPMPMFTADMQEAIKSSEIIRKLQPQRLEVCHGDAVMKPADQYDEYLERVTAKYK